MSDLTVPATQLHTGSTSGKSTKTTAAERAAATEREYLDGLRAGWKVPLSQEQYATIRRALLGTGTRRITA